MTEVPKDQVIIAIDLTEAEGVISLVRRGSEISNASLNSGKDLENFLQVSLKDILETANLVAADVTAFVVSEQSYSLTRGRIVKALIRGLADGLNIRIYEISLFRVLSERFYPNKKGQILFGYLADGKNIRFKYYDNSNEYFDKIFDEMGSVEQLFENSAGESLNVLNVKTIISPKLASFIQLKGIERDKFPEKTEILENNLGYYLGNSLVRD